MTLIEVIAGLVVLAVLISAVALARGRLLGQWETAQKKTQAARAVDRMLAGWLGSESGDSIPVPSQGGLEGAENCTWRTTFAVDPSAARVGCVIVRLEVSENGRRLFGVELLKRVAGREVKS